VIPKLEMLWRLFEEQNLIDSSGSDYEAGVDSGGEDSYDVLLVEVSDLADIVADASGGGEDWEGSAGEASSRSEQNTRKKVVSSEERRLQRKARGDGVVLGGNPLKGEKGRLL